MTDFITPKALVRQFREDSCVDCIHTDCRARRDCADELEAAAVKWAAWDAEAENRKLREALVLVDDYFNLDTKAFAEKYGDVPGALNRVASSVHAAVNRLSEVQK